MSLTLGEKVGDLDKVEQTEHAGPERKLNEILERRLRHDSTYPRAEMVHLVDAAIEFTAMMYPIQFVIVASAAELGSTIELAQEEVFHPEVLDAIAFGVCIRAFGRVALGRVGVEAILFLRVLPAIS